MPERRRTVTLRCAVGWLSPCGAPGHPAAVRWRYMHRRRLNRTASSVCLVPICLDSVAEIRPWEIELHPDDVTDEQWAIIAYPDWPCVATYRVVDARTASVWHTGKPHDHGQPEVCADEQRARAAFTQRCLICPECGCGIKRTRMTDPARCPNCAFYAAAGVPDATHRLGENR